MSLDYETTIERVWAPRLLTVSKRPDLYFMFISGRATETMAFQSDHIPRLTRTRLLLILISEFHECLMDRTYSRYRYYVHDSLPWNAVENNVLMFRVLPSWWLNPEPKFICNLSHRPGPGPTPFPKFDTSDEDSSLALILPRISAVDCSVKVGVD